MNSFDITGHRFLLLCLDDKSTINSTARNDYPPALPRALITHDNFIENILTKHFHLSNLLLFVFSIRGSRSNPKFFYAVLCFLVAREQRGIPVFIHGTTSITMPMFILAASDLFDYESNVLDSIVGNVLPLVQITLSRRILP